MGVYNQLKYLSTDQIDNTVFRNAVAAYSLDKSEFASVSNAAFKGLETITGLIRAATMVKEDDAIVPVGDNGYYSLPDLDYGIVATYLLDAKGGKSISLFRTGQPVPL